MKCLKPAGSLGLCVVHEKAAKRDPRAQRYHEAIDVVLAACHTKGWSASLDSRDGGNRLATISVTKKFDYNEVTGLVHLIVDGGVKFSIEKTSFYGYGQQDLLQAISYKLGDLPWLESKGAETERTKRQAQDTERAKQQEAHTAILIKRVLTNFDKAARQLRRRYDDRTPYAINDEYDVQDLLHAILRAYFDDVRPEEHSPSYAGSSSRIDFLLKGERSVVEVKYATTKLRDKHIGEQLIIDIKRYQSHPDCKSLYCLIYDPEESIRNPTGLERDLSGTHDKLDVTVLVVPR